MEPIEESGCALSIRGTEEPSIAQVIVLLRLASRQIVVRTSLVVRAITGDNLTLEEEDTLGGILIRSNALSLEELTALTETFVVMNPSDELSISRAHEALEALLADPEMGGILGFWIEAVRIRAQHVKWLRSASESRQLLMRKEQATVEITKATPCMEALEREEEELSATNNRLEAEIDALDREHKKIRVSLEEITGQKVG